MKYPSQLNLFILILFSGFLFTACPSLEDDSESRLLLENNESILAQRVSYTNDVIELDSIPTAGRYTTSSTPDTILLTLVAEVDPPIYNGDTLQASDVCIIGSYAYVSYNYAGEEYLGAVEVYRISNTSNPVLKSQIIFTDTDVNGVIYYSGNVYLASATNNDDFSTPAMVEKIRVRNGVLSSSSETVDIPSWAATDIDHYGINLFITSGALDGAVTYVNLSNMSIVNTISVEDARGIDRDGNDVAVIAGTPARLIVLDRRTGDIEADYSLSGATIPYSKSTVKIRKRKAILGLGDGGCQIVCLDDGSVIESIPQPELDDLPLDKTVTNSVTADKRLVFMADGEAGVYVAATESNLNSNSCSLDEFRMVGKFRIGDGISANHVEYNNDVLFVASGLGGLKILTVDMNNNEEDEDDEDDDDD